MIFLFLVCCVEKSVQILSTSTSITRVLVDTQKTSTAIFLREKPPKQYSGDLSNTKPSYACLMVLCLGLLIW